MGSELSRFKERVKSYQRGKGDWQSGNELGRELLRYSADGCDIGERIAAASLAKDLYKTIEGRFKGFKNIVEAGQFFGKWGGSKEFAFKVWDREILVFEGEYGRKVSLRKYPGDMRPVREGQFNLFGACLERGGSNIYSDVALAPGRGKVYSDGGLRILNLWEGTEAQKLIRKGGEASFEHIRYHIFNIICDRRQEEYEFILDWLCAICFRTETKTGCMPILIGAEGSGKSLFARMCSQLVGLNYSVSIGGKELSLRNSGLLNKLFINIEEGRLKKTATEYLKHIITCETISQNGKILSSHHNFLMTTNDLNPLWGHEIGRRFFELRVNNSYGIGRGHDNSRGSYFRSFLSELNNPDSLRSFARFLHERLPSVKNRLFETDNRIADNHISRSSYFGSIGQWLLDTAEGRGSKIDYRYGDYTLDRIYNLYKKWGKDRAYRGSLLSIEVFERKLDIDFSFVMRSFDSGIRLKRYYFPENGASAMLRILKANGIS